MNASAAPPLKHTAPARPDPGKFSRRRQSRIMPLSYLASPDEMTRTPRWAGYEVSDLRRHPGRGRETVSRLPLSAKARFRRDGNAAVAGGRRRAPQLARVTALAQTRSIVVRRFAPCGEAGASGERGLGARRRIDGTMAPCCRRSCHLVDGRCVRHATSRRRDGARSIDAVDAGIDARCANLNPSPVFGDAESGRQSDSRADFVYRCTPGHRKSAFSSHADVPRRHRGTQATQYECTSRAGGRIGGGSRTAARGSICR